MRTEAKASVRTPSPHPVGRTAQAVVCKTTEASATLARDSNFPGISVERHTPVFQAGVEGALPACPSISQVNRVRRQRPRTVEGACARPPGRTSDSVRLGFLFPRCEIPVSARTSQAWPRRFNSAFVSRSLQTAIRVANFDSEVPALNRRELGANPRRPTISASVVKLLSSSASNGEFAGGSPAGCTNSRRVSPTTRDTPLRTERLGVEIPHAAPFRPRSPTQRQRT